MLQGQSRLTGQTRAESVTPAAMRPTIPIGVIDASKLPSVRGKAIPSGKLGTPVRVDEGRGDGSGNDNQSPAVSRRINDAGQRFGQGDAGCQHPSDVLGRGLAVRCQSTNGGGGGNGADQPC